MRVTCCVVVMAGFFAACTAASPKDGSSCSSSDENKAVCGDDKTELVCEGGKYKSVPCKGPAGCTSNSSTVTCDTSSDIAGDACPKSQEGKAQCTTTDSHVRLTCHNGQLTSESCPILG